jgi:uncharacterized protein DUF4388
MRRAGVYFFRLVAPAEPALPVDKSLQYRGDLKQTALPEMLHTIAQGRVPGVVEAVRDGIARRVSVRGGTVVHVGSADRNDSLGVYLRRAGRLTPEIFADTMRERAESDRRYGVVLVERGLLSPAEVHEAIREQMASILWGLFGWEEGEVTFSIADFDDTQMVHLNLPMPRVILEGIRRAPNPRAMLARLGRRETLFEPSFSTEELLDAGLNAAEYKLLTLVNGRRSLYELCTAGPHAPADNAKLVYAFQVLQLIRRSDAAPGIKIKLKTEGDVFTS